jgi:hypothetical protein
MECRNHGAVTAEDRCAGCMEPFCANCLVTVRGRKYCSSCKVMAVGDRMPVVESAAAIPCTEAGEALKYAIIGIIFFGIVLEPVAFFKGMQAKKLIAANPALIGGGKATAAITISSVVMSLWAIAILSAVFT